MNLSILQGLANQAIAAHQRGNLAEAEQACLKLFQLDPVSQVVRNILGLIRSQQGRHGEALALLADAVKADPRSPTNLANQGVVLLAAGRHAEALASYDSLLTLTPDHPAAMVSRANALRGLGRFGEALAGYDTALAKQPGYPEGHYNRALMLAQMGRKEESLAAYDQALALRPNLTPAHIHRANLLHQSGRTLEALAAYDKLVGIEPRNPDAHFYRGVMLAELGRPDEALQSYGAAIAVKGNHLDALYNAGLILQNQNRLQDALRHYGRLLEFTPNHAAALNNKGVIMDLAGRFDDALAMFTAAIAADSRYAEAYYNRSTVGWRKQRGDVQAIRDLEQLIALAPDYDYAQGDLLHMRMQVGDWDGYARDLAALDAGLRAGKPVVRPFVYQALSDSPADLKLCSEIFTARYFPALPAAPHAAHQGKIRIGYLSSEFRDQATAYLMAGLFEAHDHTKFEIVALDNGGDDGGTMRARLTKCFDKFIDIVPLTDDQAAERIRAENIDILVNLSGYFGTPRMGIFSRRAAPIQVNYLGFPATLGAGYMDYILADRQVIPEAEQGFYTEKVVYLPDSYQANDNKRAIDPEMPTRAEFGLPQDAFVFCNFNQSYKLTPGAFATWMKILGEIEGSVLWILESAPGLADNLRKEAARVGIAADRLVFTGQLPAAKHLARLKLADLFLDSLPYNAHTTASDALWAGLPLVTCRGTAFPGRVAASLLMAAGLPELVTETIEDYTALAVKLARDKDQLASLRQKLADTRLSCALFDTDRFRRHIESAFETMVETSRAGKAPTGFSI